VHASALLDGISEVTKGACADMHPLFIRGKFMKRLNGARPVLAVVVMLAASVTTAYAGDVAAGKARAGMCTTCHGPLGISQLPNAPHLAGQPEIYTIEQLKHYRDGKRSNEVMAVIAKTLTDKDIEDLAAWYGSIQITVKEK
jgi:cytochrome c553